MKVEKDYEDLLRFFNKHKVKYCVVGAFAVAFYSKPRYTKDIDILVEPSFENGNKIVEALKDFGFGGLGLVADDFAKEGQIIQLGYEPVRVDIITSIGGCSFEDIWKNKHAGEYGTEKIFFIGKNELIKSKMAVNRKHDQADLESLLPNTKQHGKRR